MTLPMIRLLFLIAGLYDFLIGATFLFFGPQLFEKADVPAPNHWAYIHFGALMLIIFGTMFLAVARNPISNRNLIPYGILLKIAYSGIVGYYWATTGCPTLFKPFAIADAVMGVLFLLAYNKLLSSTERLAPS